MAEINDNTQHPIWDIATRLFHWLIVVGVALAWWSAENQEYKIHEYTGYTILVLVVSRIIWGLVGSKYSRFTDFVRGPAHILQYLRNGMPSNVTGHNPLGACSVCLLLALLLVQSVSGLFNSDDILFSGPFYYAVDSFWQDRMGVAHDLAFNALLALVALHIVSVLWHQRRGDDLLRPMLKGKTESRYSQTAPAPLWRWLLIVVVLAVALWQAIELAPKPQSNWF